MRTMVMILLMAGHFVSGQSTTEPERIRGWKGDIDTLLALMKRQHVVFRSTPLPEELLKKAALLKGSIGRYSDERMSLELEKLMYHMQDGHSYVLPFTTKRGSSHALPFQLYLFSDGAYVIDAEEPYTSLIGCRIDRMNDIGIDSIVRDMNSYVHQDNVHTVRWFAPTFLRFRGVHELYGLPPSSPAITAAGMDRQNKPFRRQIEFVPLPSLRGIPKLVPSRLAGAPPVPMYLSAVTKNYWMTPLPDRRTLYFQFNQVENAPDESLADFSARLDSALTAYEPRLLVIDVRHNNGGNKMLLRPLIRVIRKFETENNSAVVITITGRNTFSAAQVFIALLDKETNTLFAGEPSASSPNFVGEEGNIFILPWSGAIGNISTRYHESIPGDTRRWIEPDIPVALSSAEYFRNRDTVMEEILRRFGK